MKKIFLKTLYFIFIRVLRIFKPISIGVRVMLVRDDQILLVKHSYMDEWYFPGGGTKRKETLADAARREALEEVGATLGNLELFGIYTNFFELRTDHIAVFICRDFTYTGAKDWEIERIELFPFNALPENIAPGIARRITDYLNGKQPKDGLGNW